DRPAQSLSGDDFDNGRGYNYHWSATGICRWRHMGRWDRCMGGRRAVSNPSGPRFFYRGRICWGNDLLGGTRSRSSSRYAGWVSAIGNSTWVCGRCSFGHRTHGRPVRVSDAVVGMAHSFSAKRTAGDHSALHAVAYGRDTCLRKMNEEQQDDKQSRSQQFRETIIEQWPQLLVCVGLVLTFNLTNYMLTGYLPSYLQNIVKMSSTSALAIVTAVLVVLAIAVVFVARLFDMVSRKLIMSVWCGLWIVGAIPAFLLIHSGESYLIVFLGVLMVGLMLLGFNSTEPSTVPTLFPTKVRYGSTAIAFN